MITDDRLQKALTFLADTDEKAAELKVEVERAAYLLKAMKSAIIIREDGAMELRKAVAEKGSAEKTGEWLETLRQFEALTNKRKTEALIVDVWRSLNANRRVGNL